MALINCTECGKEISDKAAACPNCGYSNRTDAATQSDDLLRCPKCDSTQLTTGQKGFSGTQAVVGAALTGGIGVLAGMIGSKEVLITCLKCGCEFKAGEYEKEKKKYMRQKRKSWMIFRGILILIFGAITLYLEALQTDRIFYKIVAGMVLICIFPLAYIFVKEKKKEKTRCES